jgi:cytochrome c oxidase cbb3-type subunit 2
MSEKDPHSDHPPSRVELSAVLTVIGVIALFATAITTVLLAPRYIDPSWVQPTSHFQVQMYEIADPNFYISRSSFGSSTLDYVHHLHAGRSLLVFQESESVRLIAAPELEKYITRLGEKPVVLTSRLLLLRAPESSTMDRKKQLQEAWEGEHSDWKEKKLQRPDYQILELYDPQKAEAFSVAYGDGTDENYIGTQYVILEDPAHPAPAYFKDPGVIYVKNPQEYMPPNGRPIQNLAELNVTQPGFLSRQELIRLGEHIYAIEGCWYCHTDQTRTLIQDTVLNGSDSFAAPPSSANEYIYGQITFPSTRRIGPDLSRVGVKRPSRDWHKSHFWSPKTASVGSIMPAFRHFFDHDPRGTAKNQIGIPNYRFEAIFQYLMTKGTRITPPTQAWWQGKDPIHTTRIIEGRRAANGSE